MDEPDANQPAQPNELDPIMPNCPTIDEPGTVAEEAIVEQSAVADGATFSAASDRAMPHGAIEDLAVAGRSSAALVRWNYALTIFLSAFLLFQVQPILGRFVLPWFGGTPNVWTSCLLFFQTVLLAGYAYAHASQRWLSPRRQGVVHLGVLVVAVATLSIIPDHSWKPTEPSFPVWRILGLLTVSVGPAYFSLSSTGPLLQAWFSQAYRGRSPYRLYALSNAGSLLALLSYPFAVERILRLHEQSAVWSFGFWGFAVLCGILAVKRVFAPVEQAPATGSGSTPISFGTGVPVPTAGRRLAWLMLPALASATLMAATNHVCQDVTPIPLLWVLPLSLYLLTFIISFDHERWYHRRIIALGAVALICLSAAGDQFTALGVKLPVSFLGELAIYLSAMFLICMLCHGELVRLKPAPQFLTSFYLMIAAGGALGGLFVSVLAPMMFATFFEWKLALIVGCALALVALLDYRKGPIARLALFALPVMLAAVIGIKFGPALLADGELPLDESARNFYGTVRVIEHDRDDPAAHRYSLYSGRIVHGHQYFDLAKRNRPNSYYGPDSGAGKAFDFIGNRPGAHVGVVGLGAGTVAGFIEPGQSIRFYEINPQMLNVAKRRFSYLRDCRGRVEVVLGDGRLSLERESPQEFDLLLLDAFCGDAVPTHLLTKEAFEIYTRHMKPDGVIAVNVSNLYLNLASVVASVGREFGLKALRFDSPRDDSQGVLPAEWVLLTRNQDFLAKYPDAAKRIELNDADGPVWTDDHSDLIGILK